MLCISVSIVYCSCHFVAKRIGFMVKIISENLNYRDRSYYCGIVSGIKFEFGGGKAHLISCFGLD